MTTRNRAPEAAHRDHPGAPAHRLVWSGLVSAASVGSVVLANWASTHWSALLVGSLIVPAGTVWAGVTLTLRDLLHETLGTRGVLLAIVAGAGLSWSPASPHIAMASIVAFAVSELADSVVYARLRVRSRLGAVLGSNLVGLLTDSVLFMPLAFGSFAVLPGQILGKTAATAATVAVLLIARTTRPPVVRR
ncbi:VUT family protein [Actinokineospora sp.]|uniref:VUT family protein n=1 Tax=Actinokineospora sp. TaxID=1872133 RepID=UPI0040380AC0